MGRPRQYDPETVLDAAQAAFWSRGYASTSVADLCAATGLKKGSLYQAFGDKHALFMRVLKRYLQNGQSSLEAIAEAAPDAVLDRIGDWLRGNAHGACRSQGPGGCMAVNSLVELAPHDAQVGDFIGAHMRSIHDTLADGLRRAQRVGQVRSDRTPAALAAFLQTLITGVTTAGRAGAAAGDAVIEIGLDALRPPASSPEGR